MECMTLAEKFATTIFSVKLMHDCIHNKFESCVWYSSQSDSQILLEISPDNEHSCDDPQVVADQHV